MAVTDGYRNIGADKVNTFFADARTHTNQAGADFTAARVATALHALPGDPLGRYFAGADK